MYRGRPWQWRMTPGRPEHARPNPRVRLLIYFYRYCFSFRIQYDTVKFFIFSSNAFEQYINFFINANCFISKCSLWHSCITFFCISFVDSCEVSFQLHFCVPSLKGYKFMSLLGSLLACWKCSSLPYRMWIIYDI